MFNNKLYLIRFRTTKKVSFFARDLKTSSRKLVVLNTFMIAVILQLLA